MSKNEPPKPETLTKDAVRKHLKTSALEHLTGYLEYLGIDLDRQTEPATLDHPSEAHPGSANPATAPSFETPMMKVEQFLAENYVEPGDVVLMTRLNSIFALLIKVFDRSDFAHVAMVFQTPRNMEGLDQAMLIETSVGGIGILSLNQFLRPKVINKDTGLPPDFVVGIKRLETPWARPRHRRIAASRMLSYIDDHKYDFWLFAALASLRTRNWYMRVLMRMQKTPALRELLSRSDRFAPGRFICSGFVQYAFVNMIVTAVQKGLMSPREAERALDDIIFPPGATKFTKIEELLACTPKFLAETPKLKWKYLIHGGDVFHVSSNEEVKDFFEKTLPKRVKTVKA